MSDASDRLARSRLAIISQIQGRDRRGGDRDTGRARDHKPGDTEWEEPDHGGGPGGWFSHLKRAVSAWWRHHPAHLGLELATPVLSAYAGRKPAQFLGIAAAVGAVVMIVRPWRLISVTGLLVALVKSSQLANVVMSAMSAADFQKDHEPYR